MFFGTDFDRVLLLIVRPVCSAELRELRRRHALPTPRLSARFESAPQSIKRRLFTGEIPVLKAADEKRLLPP